MEPFLREIMACLKLVLTSVESKEGAQEKQGLGFCELMVAISLIVFKGQNSI